MGRVTYDGKVKHPVTAHPKVDPDTGEHCAHHVAFVPGLMACFLAAMTCASVLAWRNKWCTADMFENSVACIRGVTLWVKKHNRHRIPCLLR